MKRKKSAEGCYAANAVKDFARLSDGQPECQLRLTPFFLFFFLGPPTYLFDL